VIDTVSADGVVLAYIVRHGALPEQTRFLTPDDTPLQLGYVVRSAGEEIPRHAHLPVERRLVGTAEVLMVQRGRCEVDIYTDARTIVATHTLETGDILLALGGGHGFRALEDLVLFEVKQGPYPGGADKERF
jgi:hypothetical protein